MPRRISAEEFRHKQRVERRLSALPPTQPQLDLLVRWGCAEVPANQAEAATWLEKLAETRRPHKPRLW